MNSIWIYIRVWLKTAFHNSHYAECNVRTLHERTSTHIHTHAHVHNTVLFCSHFENGERNQISIWKKNSWRDTKVCTVALFTHVYYYYYWNCYSGVIMFETANINDRYCLSHWHPLAWKERYKVSIEYCWLIIVCQCICNIIRDQ